MRCADALLEQAEAQEAIGEIWTSASGGGFVSGSTSLA